MEKKLSNESNTSSHKRSIRDIPIPETRRNTTDETFVEQDSFAINLKKVKLERPASHSKKNNPYNTTTVETEEVFFKESHIKKSHSYKIPVAIVLALVAIFFVMNLFHSAKITAYPKNASADVNADLAIVDAENKKTDSELVYKKFEFTGDVTEEVTATGEEYVSEKASGTITIYNEYTTKSQSLLKNTRFEAPNGKIYRIQETVSVPGYKTVGGEVKPGTLDVVVYADEPGTGYENGMVTFKIPGFKGQPQYDSFYAKSKTNIGGGFVGTRKVLSDEQLKSAQTAATEKLKALLRKNLSDQLPSNLIAVNSDDSAFVFEDFIREDKDGDKVLIKLKGSLPVKVVDKTKLSQKVAENSIGNNYVIGTPILITNLDEMSIKMKDESTISISGAAKFIWQLEPKELKQKTVGKNRTEAINIFADFAGIERVELKFFPLWKSRFPDDVDKIEVIQVLPN